MTVSEIMVKMVKAGQTAIPLGTAVMTEKR